MPRKALLLAALAFVCCSSAPDPRPVPIAAVSKPRAPTPQEKLLAEQTPADDAMRAEVIVGFQKTGMFGPVDYKRRELVVGPKFYRQGFQTKQTAVWAVVLTGMRKANSTAWDLDLVDSNSGKTVGTYSTLWHRLEMK